MDQLTPHSINEILLDCMVLSSFFSFFLLVRYSYLAKTDPTEDVLAAPLGLHFDLTTIYAYVIVISLQSICYIFVFTYIICRLILRVRQK